MNQARLIKRLVNFFLDGFVCFFSFRIIIFFLGKVFAIRESLLIDPPNFFMRHLWVQIIFMGFFYFFYYYFFELHFQKTPAKFITESKVIDENGQKPTSKQLFQRTLIRWIPYEPFSLFLDERRSTFWHDRWSKTRVVNEEKDSIRAL